jgi:tetratricopeptide (TPR) repeat protein
MQNVMSESSPHAAEQHILRLMREGKLREAAVACDRLTQEFPDNDRGWFTASQLAIAVNEPEIALRAIDTALRINPTKPEWLSQKVSILAVSGYVDAAASLAQELASHVFDDAYTAAAFGLTLTRLGLLEDAERHYRAAIELDPDNGSHYYNLATVQRFLGAPEQASSCLDRAIELNPDDCDAHYLKSSLRTQTSEQNNVASLRAALTRISEKHPGRVALQFALAKELEDLGEYEASFDSLRVGASARRKSMRYDAARDLATLQKIREVYTEEMFDGSVDGFINAEPIFMIGMPRTGTTLVDRILSSHPAVQSMGELQTFGIELVNQCRRLSDIAPGSPAELVSVSKNIDFAALGESYVTAARSETAGTAHFTDKLPMNFLYAGLIHLALPKSKLIWLDRDPLDTCYAVFKTMFKGAYPYSYDLSELASYYVEYQRLRDHWCNVMPDRIHFVRYESLVSEPRSAIEDLLSYCGLSWEQACLDFHETEGVITTASATQARMPVYQSSVGKWRNYEKQMGPVIEILNDAGIPIDD